MQVVVETPEYLKQAGKCMDIGSRIDFIEYIARNPLAGDLMVGTGGVRKIRWTGDSNRGKGAEFVLFTIITIPPFQFFFLLFIVKMKRQIYLRQNVIACRRLLEKL